MYMCLVDHVLSFSLFSFVYCIVHPLVYGFWLSPWYLHKRFLDHYISWTWHISGNASLFLQEIAKCQPHSRGPPGFDDMDIRCFLRFFEDFFLSRYDSVVLLYFEFCYPVLVQINTTRNCMANKRLTCFYLLATSIICPLPL